MTSPSIRPVPCAAAIVANIQSTSHAPKANIAFRIAVSPVPFNPVPLLPAVFIPAWARRRQGPARNFERRSRLVRGRGYVRLPDGNARNPGSVRRRFHLARRFVENVLGDIFGGGILDVERLQLVQIPVIERT